MNKGYDLYIQIVKFAKLMSLHHNDIRSILWGHSSTVNHIWLAPLRGFLRPLKWPDIAKSHSVLSTSHSILLIQVNLQWIKMNLKNHPNHPDHLTTWRTLPCSLWVPSVSFFLSSCRTFQSTKICKIFSHLKLTTNGSTLSSVPWFSMFICLFVCWMMFSCFFYNGCRLFIYFIGWQRVRSLLGALRRGYGVDCDKLQCLPNTWNVFQNVYQTPEMFSKMLTKHLKCFPKKYKMFTNHLRSQAKKFCSCSSKWKKWIEMGTNKH